MTFQFWWHFSFDDISVLVTFQVWWHFSFGDLIIFKGLSKIAVSLALQTTNRQASTQIYCHSRFISWTGRNLYILNIKRHKNQTIALFQKLRRFSRRGGFCLDIFTPQNTAAGKKLARFCLTIEFEKCLRAGCKTGLSNKFLNIL